MSIALPLLAAAFFLVRLALMVTLHVVASPYNPVRHAFSDYAVGPTRRLTMAASLVNAVCWATLAAAVYVAAPEWSYRTVATVMLVGLTVLSVVVIALPTDVEGSRLTRRGIAHYVVAIATFALAYSLTGDASRLIEAAGPAWAGTTLTVLHWITLVGLIGLCAGLVLPKIRPFFGLLERVFLFAIAVFYLLFGVALVS